MIPGMSGKELMEILKSTIDSLPVESQPAVWTRLAEISQKYQRGEISSEAYAFGLTPEGLFLPEEIKILREAGLIRSASEAPSLLLS